MIKKLMEKYKNFIDKIRSRRPSAYFRLAWKISFAVLLLPLALTLRLLAPLVLIRFAGLNNEKFGHLLLNVELYLCEMDSGVGRPHGLYIDIFYYARERTCNRFLRHIWGRKINIWPSWFIEPLAFSTIRLLRGRAHEVGENANHDRDVLNLLDRTPSHLIFTPPEIRKGRRLLENIGISSDSKFVCLCARDSTAPSQPSDLYRNVQVETYYRASEELIRRGYLVVRMGAAAERDFGVIPGIIDYARSSQRTDFLDIYIASRCEFMIACATGCNAAATAFRKPTVFTNFFPISYLPTWGKSDLIINKKFVRESDGYVLPLSEVVELETRLFKEGLTLEAEGIKVLDNSPNEILDVVVEMEDRLSGRWTDSEFGNHLQSLYWFNYPKEMLDDAGRRLHGRVMARIGTRYLELNSKFLLH